MEKQEEQLINEQIEQQFKMSTYEAIDRVEDEIVRIANQLELPVSAVLTHFTGVLSDRIESIDKPEVHLFHGRYGIQAQVKTEVASFVYLFPMKEEETEEAFKKRVLEEFQSEEEEYRSRFEEGN